MLNDSESKANAKHTYLYMHVFVTEPIRTHKYITYGIRMCLNRKRNEHIHV